MSITTTAVTNMSATSATGAPFTVTATVEPAPGCETHLVVVVDGETRRFRINLTRLAFRPTCTVIDEAERQLTRNAGLRVTGPWVTADNGRLAAPVAEIAGRCTTCVQGCECERGSDGCGHHGCWAAGDDIRHTCAFAKVIDAARMPKPHRAPRTRR